MLENRYGPQIDQHDFVVRLKRSIETLAFPEHFGRFTEAVCGSWTIRDMDGFPVAREQWAFVDSRHDDVIPDDIMDWLRSGRPGVTRLCNPKLCREWNARYREMRTPFERWRQTEAKPSSDELGHLHMSAGLHAILYAIAQGGDRITLYGFDNVKNGEFTWSVTRGPEWNQYPDHRWDIEHQMIPVFAEESGVEINFA